MKLANDLGWLDVDALLGAMSREQFNERWAAALLDEREAAQALQGPTGFSEVPEADNDVDAWMRAQCGM